MENQSISWDHGKRRLMLGLSAAALALAVFAASVGGSVVSINAARKIDGKKQHIVEQPIEVQRSVAWG